MAGLSWQARLLNPVLKTFLRPVVFPKVATPLTMTLTATAMAVAERLRPTLTDASITPIVQPEFKGEWVEAAGANPERVLLYFHGGGYMQLSPLGYRDFTAALSRRCGMRVLAVDYQQGAHHPWPAPLRDAMASYRWLMAQGIAPDNIVIAGDSAGGHLTLSTLLAIRDQGLPRPCGGVTLSPWTNMACDFQSHDANRDSDVVLAIGAIRSNAVYQSQGELNLRDPGFSPAFADYHGLPPLYILVSDSEILFDDARAVRDAARAAGVEVCYREWSGLPHVFPILGPLLPEAVEAQADIADFVTSLFA